MNGKLIAGVIAGMLLINGILVTIALQKRGIKSASVPAQIVREAPTSIPINEFSSRYKAAAETASKTGLENCFNYYNYGNIQVNLSAEKAEYESAQSVKLTGSIINNNTFPITDVVLYAQVKRINTKTYNDNGHYLIDTFPLLEHISIQARETKPITAQLPIKPEYPQGAYQLQYFIFSPHGFHYGGRTFLEEDMAGTTNLTLKTTTLPSVYFDLDNVQAENKPQIIRGIIKEFSSSTIPFNIRLIDTRSDKMPIPVEIKFYSFEDTNPSNLVSQQTLTVEDTNNPIQVEFTPPEQGAYLLVATAQTPVRTMLRYRFGALSGDKPEVRINDMGVSSFPATADGRAWVCFHSPANSFTPKTKITLSLLDNNKQLVEQNSIEYVLPPDVLAISVPLAKLSSINSFSVQAQFENTEDPSKKKEIQMEYTCDTFTQSLKDFSIVQTKQKPYELTVFATNNCGDEVKTGTINNIRIVQNETVQKEETNINQLPYTFSLEGLSAGSYLAQVRIGTRSKEIPIELPGTTAKLKQDTEQFKREYLIFAAIIAMITILVVILLRKNGKL